MPADISYDANGNIKRLNRNAKDYQGEGNFLDHMQYIYKDETNQLEQIRDGSPSDWWDGEMTNQLLFNYTYDATGQLVESNDDDLEIEYDVYGKVKTLKQKSTGEIKAEYFYNEAGFRVKKVVYPSPTVSVTTHYVRDNSGTVFSIYEDAVQAEVPIYGSGRLGVYYKAADQTVYELSDHLGNVRTTFIYNNGTAEQQSFADYYPFGWKLPGRQTTGSEQYRYGYQGQFAEEDSETGWNQFELRMWDGRIGRWMSTDPYGQYHSPYLGMGNNPVFNVDPDGGLIPPGGDDFENGTVHTDADGTWIFSDGIWKAHSDGALEFGDLAAAGIIDDINITAKWNLVDAVIGFVNRQLNPTETERYHVYSKIGRRPEPGDSDTGGAKVVSVTDFNFDEFATPVRNTNKKMGRSVLQKSYYYIDGLNRLMTGVEVGSELNSVIAPSSNEMPLTPNNKVEIKNDTTLRLNVKQSSGWWKAGYHTISKDSLNKLGNVNNSPQLPMVPYNK